MVELYQVTLPDLLVVDVLVDVEFPHEGKQPEPLYVKEWSGPHGFPWYVPWKGLGSKGVVKVRNGSEVPGVTGQGARKKAVLVVDEVGDDCFTDIQGKSDGR